MREDQIVTKVIEEIQKNMRPADPVSAKKNAEAITNSVTEFVGFNAELGETIGLVVANLDDSLRELMGIDKKYHSVGIVAARLGAAPQLMAADEAVKSSNAELIIFEMPRDTKGHAGHGSFLVFGADEVSDARRSVEVTLEYLNHSFGEIYWNDFGLIECQFTARCSQAISSQLGAPIGRPFGIVVAGPAAIGMLIADAALKAATIEPIMYASPGHVTSHSNEFLLMFTGESGAVKQAVITARNVAKQVLTQCGGPLTSMRPSYLDGLQS